jgi:hypothetical protein
MICDSPLAALFTPPHPRGGRYEVCTTTDPIESAAGAGDIEALPPLDAFGVAGPYDRAALSRLFGGGRVRVARRWERKGAEFVSLTYLSPYPDPQLTRLESGTMLIRFTITAKPAEHAKQTFSAGSAGSPVNVFRR